MHSSHLRRYLKHGTLPQLRVFEAVVRHGSFTRAADELHMSQPTVSIQIRKLAETVGMPLFEQMGKRIHPTPIARELYGACQDIFRTLSDVDRSITDLQGLKKGKLKLATSSAGKYLASRVVTAFVRQHPDMEVALHVTQREGLISRLGDNRDNIYLMTKLPADQDVVTQRILPNPMVVFASASHPLASERGIAFSRFVEEPLIMREPGSGTRLITEHAFASHGAVPRARMELGDNESIRDALLADLGVAVMSRHALGLEPDRQLVTLDVEGFPIEAHWHLVYPQGKQLTPIAQAFMQFLRIEAPHLMAPAARH